MLQLVNMNPTGCSDGVEKQLQVVLAEPVRQDILLSFEQQKNHHHHQRVNVDDEAKDREEPSKSNIILL